jgi:NADH-quinone oxidoreductase subunit C
MEELKITSDLETILSTITNIKEDYPILISITAVDRPDQTIRFTLVYNFLSIEKIQRLSLTIPVTSCSIVPSIVKIYQNANWYEREVWDLFGIPFENHPDLRRIMTDYGFAGHPLRKDFPLSGHQEVIFSEGKVKYQALNLSQPFRDFDSITGWLGPLPGDEKASK